MDGNGATKNSQNQKEKEKLQHSTANKSKAVVK